MSKKNAPLLIEIHEPEDQRDHPIFGMFGRAISFHRCFVSLTGGVTSALMLSQAMYWSQRTSNPAGWFYKTVEEWEEETGLTRREQSTARKLLARFDWWQEDLRKANGAPTLHFRIDANRFARNVQSHLRETRKSIYAKRANDLTEITTEITTVSHAQRGEAGGTAKQHDHNNTGADDEPTQAELLPVVVVQKPKDHPCVKAYHEFTERYPTKAQMKLIAERNPDLESWNRAMRAWIGRNYNPGNIDKMLEWSFDPSGMEWRPAGKAKHDPTDGATWAELFEQSEQNWRADDD